MTKSKVEVIKTASDEVALESLIVLDGNQPL